MFSMKSLNSIKIFWAFGPIIFFTLFPFVIYIHDRIVSAIFNFIAPWVMIAMAFYSPLKEDAAYKDSLVKTIKSDDLFKLIPWILFAICALIILVKYSDSIKNYYTDQIHLQLMSILCAIVIYRRVKIIIKHLNSDRHDSVTISMNTSTSEINCNQE